MIPNLLVIIYLLFSSPLCAQEIPPTKTESSENLEEESLRELDLDFEESREKFESGYFISIGRQFPWSIYAVGIEKRLSPGASIIWSFSGTQRVTNSSQDQQNYELTTNARVASGAYKVFVTNHLPLTFTLGGSLVHWRGHIMPQGAKVDEEHNPEPILLAGYQALGPALWASIGLSYYLSNGILIEYSALGLGKANVLSKKFTGDSDTSKKAIENSLENFDTWGLINIRIGWFL